jgi:hypothetical protein
MQICAYLYLPMSSSLMVPEIVAGPWAAAAVRMAAPDIAHCRWRRGMRSSRQFACRRSRTSTGTECQ